MTQERNRQNRTTKNIPIALIVCVLANSRIHAPRDARLGERPRWLAGLMLLRLLSIQRPFLFVRPSRAKAGKEALCRGSIGPNSFLKVTD
jgi:hypothetical protein